MLGQSDPPPGGIGRDLPQCSHLPAGDGHGDELVDQHRALAHGSIELPGSLEGGLGPSHRTTPGGGQRVGEQQLLQVDDAQQVWQSRRAAPVELQLPARRFVPGQFTADGVDRLRLSRQVGGNALGQGIEPGLWPGELSGEVVLQLALDAAVIGELGSTGPRTLFSVSGYQVDAQHGAQRLEPQRGGVGFARRKTVQDLLPRAEPSLPLSLNQPALGRRDEAAVGRATSSSL